MAMFLLGLENRTPPAALNYLCQTSKHHWLRCLNMQISGSVLCVLAHFTTRVVWGSAFFRDALVTCQITLEVPATDTNKL